MWHHILLRLLLSTATQPEPAVLRGVVLLNTLEGPPVINAEVSSVSSPKATDNSGCFELPFPNQHPGEDVVLTVHKEGYVVVHEIMLTCTVKDRARG